MPPAGYTCSEPVSEALAGGKPVVALESTILSHGLPRPRNLEVGQELEERIRNAGAVPATIAVLDGIPCVGLDAEQLERVALDPALRKISQRDLPLAAATRASGGTTVAATAALAAAAGIRVFATGGLGGVHRGWHETWDESADLLTLATTRITIVCAGVKSILDVGATLQRLETLNVSVAGYGTDEFPGFYLRRSGFPVEWRLDSPEQVAAVMDAQDDLRLPAGALVIANPVPADAQLDPEQHDRVLAEALDAAAAQHVGGQALTPFLLDFMFRGTDGASLDANLAAVAGNVDLAAAIAVAARAETR